jgi:hypothetical protein
MPLPLAPLLPLAVRLGVVSAATLAARRWIRLQSFPGRTDQRAEDALDDLGEGLSLHHPPDRNGVGESQTNGTARMVRVIRLRGRTYRIDAAVLARFRVRRSAG